MNLLHEGAFSMVNGSDVEDPDSGKPSLDLYYGDLSPFVEERATFWFRRVPDEPQKPEKSTEVPEGKRKKRDPPGPPANKQRKMRNNRVQDVGSMLGNFMS